MKTIRFLGAGMLMLLVVACGNPDLSRSKVQSLIQSNVEFSKPQEAATLTSGARKEGESQGFWNGREEVTSKGQKTFVALRWGKLVVREALRREITAVTGIADAVSPLGGATGGLKEAHFQWEYTNVKGPARRFIVRGGTGVALVRLYDDGWRIEELNMKEGAKGFVLSPAEKAAAEQDRQAELVRRRAEQERLAQEAERKRQEKERRDRRIAESKKMKRVIGSFACLDSFTGRSRSGKEITLTDVSVKHNCRSREDRWYGGVKQYQSTSCTQTAMGWTKPCVILKPGNTWLVFGDEARRDIFFAELTSAITNWRSKYPDLR